MGLLVVQISMLDVYIDEGNAAKTLGSLCSQGQSRLRYCASVCEPMGAWITLQVGFWKNLRYYASGPSFLAKVKPRNWLTIVALGDVLDARKSELLRVCHTTP